MTTNILIAPAFLELRATLLSALQPHPEARRAAASALLQIEHRLAQDAASA